MAMDRATIIRGPAVVQYNTVTFYTKGDIEVKFGLETFNVETDSFGNAPERLKDRLVEVTFTPVGEWESMATLFPYAATLPGTSIFGSAAAEKALVIHTLAGVKLTFPCAAVTKLADISASAVKTLFGQVTFTCLGKGNTAWSVADSIMDVAAAAFADATFNPANIKTVPFAVAWGIAPWDAINTRDGVTVSFDLQTEKVETDTDGVIDMTFKDLGVMAKLTPVGVTEAQVDTALGWQGVATAVRGGSLDALANDLVLTGAGAGAPVITVKKAAMKTAGYRFGSTALRHGELGFVAQRQWTAGVAQPLYTLA